MKINNPAIIKQATSLFDVDMNTLRFLGGEDGDVYEAQTVDQACILKLVPATEQGIQTLTEKIAFAHYLRDNGVRLAQWLPSNNGQLVEVIEDGKSIVAVTKVEKVTGRHPNMRSTSEWNAELFRKWGRILGLMHHLSQRFEDGEHIGHWHDEVAFFINWCSDPEIKPHWFDMETYLKTLPRPGNAYGLIHNDLHQWNFMLDGDEIIIFDFDVCNHHWFNTDIAIALFHGLWVDSWRDTQVTRARTQMLYDSFIEGYKSENTLDAEWRERLRHFLKYRQLLSHTVFSDAKSLANASGWQRRWVAEMRRGIVNNIPVLNLRF
jgi:Ser/Thr protein kinase RdoA (MazF antagonist)